MKFVLVRLNSDSVIMYNCFHIVGYSHLPFGLYVSIILQKDYRHKHLE